MNEAFFHCLEASSYGRCPIAVIKIKITHHHQTHPVAISPKSRSAAEPAGSLPSLLHVESIDCPDSARTAVAVVAVQQTRQSTPVSLAMPSSDAPACGHHHFLVHHSGRFLHHVTNFGHMEARLGHPNSSVPHAACGCGCETADRRNIAGMQLKMDCVPMLNGRWQESNATDFKPANKCVSRRRASETARDLLPHPR
ncbi:hypothetical protein C8035_v001285 [Colletotrichum spinosum]|uniref:Uncharacterized protein n=1 Tax=Colletotrichum spinosum TaxID=1347390 RepID=A0A4R8Q0B5_9PEZI|nr:hypothetical protein C8035_v001285 [Colletotrichum spinosum]